MSKSKTGREIVDRFYRDLERQYSIKIVNGQVDDFSASGLRLGVREPLYDAVDALEKTIAKLPAPEHPGKKRSRKPRGKGLDA